jgi:hypothetical protein
MYIAEKLEGNPQKLTGNLLIKGMDPFNDRDYFALASTDSKRFYSLANIYRPNLESIVNEKRSVTTKTKVENDYFGYILFGFSSPDKPFGPLFEDIDIYHIGVVSNQVEFIDISMKTALYYFLENDIQQEKKHQESIKPKLTVYDIPNNKVLPELLKRAAYLLKPVSSKGIIAHMEAEDSLQDFVFSENLKYSAKEIISLLNYQGSGRTDLILLQFRIIEAVVNKEYGLANDLHKYYERLKSNAQ